VTSQKKRPAGPEHLGTGQALTTASSTWNNIPAWR
jgi:hypothetical protein